MSPSALRIAHVAALLSLVDGANILAIFASQYASHRQQFRPLTRALAARGHHVTVLSGFPESRPVANYRDIVIDGVRETADAAVDFTRLAPQNPVGAVLSLLTLMDGMEHVLHHTVKSNGTQTLLHCQDKFDLIFIDITSDEAYYGFVHKFGYPPTIALSPFGYTTIGNMLMGNPETPSAIPSTFLPFGDRMTLRERVQNALMFVGTSIYTRLVYLPKMDALLKVMFGEEAPTVAAISRQISMLMVTTDAALGYPRPLVPATVLVGGMHLKPAEALPNDLQRYLDASAHGAIYFSLGSVIRSDRMDRGKLAALLDAFAALPQRVLWKWESDAVPALPGNVRVAKWLPQNDVLAHPNVRLFITHGGISSLEEAVYHAVPMVAMPFFGDQPFQARKIVDRGIGVALDYRTLTTRSLLDAVGRVLNDSSFLANVQRLSAIYRDQPQPPLERAVFWTEYVLRHNGAQHLRHAGSVLPWYLHLQLDLYALLLAVGVVLLAATVGVVRVVALGLLHLFGRRLPRGKIVCGVAALTLAPVRVARRSVGAIVSLCAAHRGGAFSKERAA